LTLERSPSLICDVGRVSGVPAAPPLKTLDFDSDWIFFEFSARDQRRVSDSSDTEVRVVVSTMILRSFTAFALLILTTSLPVTAQFNIFDQFFGGGGQQQQQQQQGRGVDWYKQHYDAGLSLHNTNSSRM
jgi:hypothetical protein